MIVVTFPIGCYYIWHGTNDLESSNIIAYNRVESYMNLTGVIVEMSY